MLTEAHGECQVPCSIIPCLRLLRKLTEIRARLVGSKPSCPPVCLCQHGLNIGMHDHTWLFRWVLGVRAQLLALVQTLLPTHWAISVAFRLCPLCFFQWLLGLLSVRGEYHLGKLPSSAPRWEKELCFFLSQAFLTFSFPKEKARRFVEGSYLYSVKKP